jgi:hypothetical protein
VILVEVDDVCVESLPSPRIVLAVLLLEVVGRLEGETLETTEETIDRSTAALLVPRSCYRVLLRESGCLLFSPRSSSNGSDASLLSKSA